jgi:hypothetical protein
VSHRLQVVVPDPVASQLRELAAAAGEPPSTLAAQMIRKDVAKAAGEGKHRPLAGRHEGQRARWLEPYGGDRSWRVEMWGAVVALHGRYPRYLDSLKEGWWKDDAHTETLCALAVWRGEIDDAGQSPREEIAFQTQLADFAQTLRQQGGGVSKAWKPGAPPPEWCRAS